MRGTSFWSAPFHVCTWNLGWYCQVLSNYCAFMYLMTEIFSVSAFLFFWGMLVECFRWILQQFCRNMTHLVNRDTDFVVAGIFSVMFWHFVVRLYNLFSLQINWYLVVLELFLKNMVEFCGYLCNPLNSQTATCKLNIWLFWMRMMFLVQLVGLCRFTSLAFQQIVSYSLMGYWSILLVYWGFHPPTAW